MGLIAIYLDVFNKVLVGVNGSPTTVPNQFYGDTPTFQIFPVVPPLSGNPNQPYTAVSYAGFTMNLTMAGTPNATTPPTPFASFDSMVWNVASNSFTGTVDLTQAAVGTYIGATAGQVAYFNLDVFDANLKRTTLLQVTFNINASIDTAVVGPGGNAAQYATLAQLQGQFVQIDGNVNGKFIVLRSPDGTQKKTFYLGNDGVIHFD